MINTDLSYKTAISRNKLSAPMQYLLNKNFISGNCLDFGCGKGFDANTLNLHKYDPHFYPTLPNILFDNIFCNYVLNVIPLEQENKILNEIKALLKTGGRAFITVRRDISVEGYTVKGTLQRNVILSLPIVYESKNKFCIYLLEK